MKPAHVLAAVVLSLGTTSSALAACSDPAARGVEWHGCGLTGANLTGAYLYGAYLIEADLTGADLSGANLSGADLSLATWVDGRDCAQGSIGECK